MKTGVYATDEGKLVIPLYYRPCKVPMELRALQWIDFQHGYEQGLEALLHSLHRQAGRATTPASSLQSQTSQPGQLPRSNLPAQLTPLVGRQREIHAIGALLGQSEVRLLTLTGMAGIGKTRLALQVAADVSEQFPDGVFLVPLAPISDPEQVIPAILQTLSIGDISGQTPLQRLKMMLNEKQQLLVLDNFEQVIQAAVAVAELLAASPQLKVLVTSRIVLHLQAEREFVVPPLRVPNPKRLPDLETLSQYEAVALFLACAQVVKPDLTLTAANAPAIASICAKLDGLPLAIELAAARSKYFAPQALLTRLEQGLSVLSGGARDLPVRQQTLRGALAWSYDLLEPEEEQLFRRLSVFVDGCTWLAAEQVCSAAGPLQSDILEGLFSLADKSLLRHEEAAEGAGKEQTEPRFSMLQTLREFGLEMLAGAGETSVTRQAHAEYYLALVEQAEPHLRGAGQAHWVVRLEQEHENLRAALSWLLESASLAARTPEGQQQAEYAFRLSVALSWFWVIRGYLREGLAFLQQELAAPEQVQASLRARALYTEAELAWTLDDLEQTEKLSAECLHLFRELGDKVGTADSLMLLGTVAWARSAYAMARPQLEEAATLYQQLGESWKRERCFTQLARIDTAQGQYDRAHELLEESLVLYRALGDKERISWALYLLARLLLLSKRDLAHARKLTEQSLVLLQEVESPWRRAYPLVLLGQLILQQKERARELFEQSLVSFKEVGDQGGTADALMGLASVARLQGDLVAAHALYQESLVLESETDYKEGMAPTLEGLAAVAAHQGELERAARLWGSAEALRETMETPIPSVERADYERAVAEARSQLDAETFAAAWAEGRALPLEQVLAELLKPAS